MARCFGLHAIKITSTASRSELTRVLASKYPQLVSVELAEAAQPPAAPSLIPSLFLC